MPMASTLCIATQLGGPKNKLPPRQVTDPPHGTFRFSSMGARKFRGRKLGLCGKLNLRGLLLKCETTEYGSLPEENGEDGVAMGTLIWRAIKLPIYSVALVPLMVGSAASYFQSGSFSTRLFVVILASSVLIISWLNLR